VLRGRARDASDDQRTFDVEVAGRPETRRVVEVPWSPDDQTRLSRVLVWSTAITLGLIGVLYALARWSG
jgi:hypothetical protein